MRVLFLTLAFLSTLLPASLPCCAGEDFFEKQVRPLLVKHCYECHSGDKAGGGLSLESRSGWQRGGESGGAVIVPGKPEKSLLVDAINYRTLEMPPSDAGGKLSEEDIEILTRWIATGATDPREKQDKLGGMSLQQAGTWWAFQPLADRDPAMSSAVIDQMIDDALERHSLKPNPQTDRRTLIRRATYDLTGLPPTPEQVRAFIEDDAPDAFAKLIDRLLDSPQYGVRWGRHWLDVVRYADTAGENTDRPLPHAWRYRNWVIDAFNRDLPYDNFVRLQIAGDILRAGEAGEARKEGIIATGYLAIARRFGHDIDKDIHLMHEDVIDNLGKNFLGIAVGCARCHDHKYDPITSEDYYALYGIFQSTRFAFPGCEPKGQPRDLVPLIDPVRADALQAEYQRQMAEYEQAKNRPAELTQSLKKIAANSFRVLASENVKEGSSVPIGVAGDSLDPISMGQGEVLQLAVLPNGNYGADSTRIEWEITQVGGDAVTWKVADLIPTLIDDKPLIDDKGATWCFLNVEDGPVFLHERRESLSDNRDLRAWTIADTPSAFVNVSQSPVSVWTTLPPQSFFVHPGPTAPVAIAWICPADGEYQIRGLVADAHPSGGDGVSFRLEHLASAEVGAGLRQLGEMSASPIPKPEPPNIPLAYAVVESDAKHARLQQRGDPELLGDEIPRRWLSVFGAEAVSPESESGRRQLADWIADHPLTARVMVNRVWQWHFGRGLVDTPNDFGSRGSAPSHPRLLDALAAEFQAGGYQIKPLHRMIMNTSAYQRSSNVSQQQRRVDPDNRLLARLDRRRLSAEEIRDSLMMAGGNLNLSRAGPHPFPPKETWNFTQHAPFNAVYESDRRSVYLMVQRQRRHPFLALFDGADPNASTAGRETTTVPTQALYFLNSPVFHAQATSVAERLIDYPEDQRISRAFQILYQREPNDFESAQATRFLNQYPGDLQQKWAAYARVLLAGNEWIYLD